MFDCDQKPLVTVDWDQTTDQHPGPYQPGWRRSWFRRHRTRLADDEYPGQPSLFTP